MRKIKVSLGTNSYWIYVGSGLLERTGVLLKEHGLTGKTVIITDPTVKKLHGEALEQSLVDQGFKVTTLLVPEGEENKSLETAGKLYDELSSLYAERTTPILAMGGGVIGDLAGFVAATYMRGLPLVQIPTTLLAQVDSSIGGKVAIDHGHLKNGIGAFYQPRLVITDIDMLRSLTPGELSNGLAEIIKYAVIKDKSLFSYLEKNLDKIKLLYNSSIEEIIFRSARIKARIVEKDEREQGGLRIILNFGHTIGHALESVSEFKIRHGEAVALGMLAAGKIANKRGLFEKDDLTRLRKVIEDADLPINMPNLNIGKVLEAIKHDKKVQMERIRLILPKAIGKVFVADEADLSLIEQILVGWYEET